MGPVHVGHPRVAPHQLALLQSSAKPNGAKVNHNKYKKSKKSKGKPSPKAAMLNLGAKPRVPIRKGMQLANLNANPAQANIVNNFLQNIRAAPGGKPPMAGPGPAA